MSQGRPTGVRRQRLLEEVMTRDGPFCFYCEAELLPPSSEMRSSPWWPILEHVLPRTLGGSNRLENLVASCGPCDRKKGNGWQQLAQIVRVLRAKNERLRGLLDGGACEAAPCPDCTDGLWHEADGRRCPTCDGRGWLSAEEAVGIIQAARAKAKAARKDQADARREVRQLRDVLEDGHVGSFDPRVLRRQLVGQAKVIRQLSDRLLTLKVEHARATGADLARMIPRADERERALGLVDAALQGDGPR